MERARLPFASGWYTAGTHPDLWEGDGTYSLIPETALPPIDLDRFDGSFSWLPPLPQGDDPLDFESRAQSIANLERASLEAAKRRFSIPSAFTRFMTTPELHRRVPTCTACYLDVSKGLIHGPAEGGGHLLRFMNDQQTVLVWYLYLQPGGGHCVLVGIPEWRDDAQGDTLEDAIDVHEFRVCGPTFESFLFRFWIENAIWYALHNGRPLTPEQVAYVTHARTARPR
jgi:hypothetical protein